MPLWHAEAAGVHPSSPGVNQFGLGWGYLLDVAANASVLTTYYVGGDDGGLGSQERVFGMGYATKTASAGGLTARQTVVAPYGDDAVLVSMVTLTNTGSVPRSAAWVENGGGALRLLDRLSATATGPGEFRDGRAFAEAHYSSEFAPVEAGVGGIRQARTWRPLNTSETEAYETVVGGMRMSVSGGPPMPYPPASSSQWAQVPPAAALVDVSPPGSGVAAATFGSDCAAFYGHGGRRAPDGLRSPLVLPVAVGPAANSVGCLLAAKSVDLPPGASVTLAFLWSYDTDGGAALPALAAKYSAAVADGSLVSSTVSAWLNVSYHVTGSAAWVSREVLWHSYMLLSAATVDDGFGERILDQGTSYRYAAGFQGAPRDPAQHLLPAVAAVPALARSVLRYLLKMVQRSPAAYNGTSAIGGVPMNLPYGAVNSYMLYNSWLRPSDQEMYVMLAAADYLLATRDFGFLDEPLQLYGDLPDGPSVPAVAALQACLNFTIVNVSVGRHGLMRVLTGDWSDSLCQILAPGCQDGPGTPQWDAYYDTGESVLNAAMATYVLPRFADALAAADAARFAVDIARARAFAAAQTSALAPGSAAWSPSHAWLRRMYISNVTGWAGDANLFGVQHAWALLSGAVASSSAPPILDALRSVLQSASPIGMPVVFPPISPSGGNPPHEGENGGVWPALNHPLAWAIGRYNLTMAWDEWAANSLRTSADVYPDYYASVWSSADSANGVGAAPGAGRAGSWTTSWPTQCTHRHAWPLYSLQRLAGLDFDAHGLVVRPGLAPPGGEGGGSTWELSTPAVSIARTPQGWQGRWTPQPGSVPSRLAALGVSAALPIEVPIGGEATVTCEWAVRCGGAAVGTRRVSNVTLRPASSAEAARTTAAGSGSRHTLIIMMAHLSESPIAECAELRWELACPAIARAALESASG